MYLYIIIALIILIIGAYRAYKQRNDYQAFSAILTLSASLCISILTFPYFLMYGDDLFITILHTIRYGLTSIGMNADGDIIPTLNLIEPVKSVYTLLLYSLYIICPISASIFIVSFSKSIVRFLKLLNRKTIHVFSDLDERSLMIAESIKKKHEDMAVLFYNCSGYDEGLEKKARELHCFLIEKDISSLKLQRNKNYELYVLDEDEQNCLNKMTDLCEKLLKQKDFSKDKVIVRCLVDDSNSELIRNLNRKYGNSIYLRFLDSDNSLAIDLLMKYRDLLVRRKKRNIFICGSNGFAYEVLKNLMCFLNQPSSYYNIELFDEDIKVLAEKVKTNAPEILNLDLEDYFSRKPLKNANYNVRFNEVAADSSDLFKLIGKLDIPDLVIICGNYDEYNFSLSENIKRYYASNNDKLSHPSIVCVMKDEQINKLVDDEGIDLIGSYKEIYDYDLLVNPKIEKAAKRAHLSYIGIETLDYDEERKEKLLDESGFYYYDNQASSYNVALGLNYHLAYILSLNKEDSEPKEFVEKWLNNKNNMTKLAESEHCRWNTYQRFMGYRGVNDKQLEKMFENYHGGSIKDDKLRLHPALVEYDKLEEREKKVDALYKKYKIERKSRYVQLDKDFLSKLLVILDYE